MKFDEILTEVETSLEHEGRISYRMLKRRFELDDDDIEDLKAELIDAKRVAHDEENKVIVWARDTPKEDPGAKDIPVEADRRLLTVMFCDIVDSTALSEQFDAEELRDVIRQYQQTCADVIERFEGHIAQYLGDGLLVYFGYPIAQEDEAYQAVRSGLEILRSLHQVTAITDRLGAPMRVRIGIHSGPVVIGEMGGAGRTERLALGDTPNIAARVQSTARPDELLISESTQRLVEGLFSVEALGAQDLKGVSKPFDLFRVNGESTAESPFEVALSTGRLTRFIGQQEELSLLSQHWAQAQRGSGQIVLLSADPGMGKSRLAQEFKDRFSGSDSRHMTFRCSPYHQTSAFYPVIQVLQRAFRFDADDSAATKVAKVEATLASYEFSHDNAAVLMCALLSLPHPQQKSLEVGDAHKHRQHLFQLLNEWFLEESRRAPVYMIWDDLHWADPSTLDLIDHYLDHVPTSATMALLIYRSNYIPSWKQRGYFRHLSLNRLSDAHIEELAHSIAGTDHLPSRIVQQIVDKTDGVPLFVEELTRTIIESGLLDAVSESDGKLDFDLLIPMTLQDSLEARLDLCPTGKDIAQWGATLGREFSYTLLRSMIDDERRLKTGIAELLDAELIYRSGSAAEPTFIFKHALVRDTAYDSLLIRKRRQYHAQIAQTLENEFPRIGETQPEVIAHHYTEGQRTDDAVRYWYRAGRYASDRSADQEALGHLAQGIKLLIDLPVTEERAKSELDFQLLLGTLTISTQGNSAPEVENIYRRAVALCDEIGDSADRTPAYFGLRSYYLTNGDLTAEHEISEAMFVSAQKDGDEDSLLEASVALANSYFYLGDETSAFQHANAASEIYAVERHGTHAAIYGLDPGATCQVRLAEISWLRGASTDALKHLESAIAICEEIAHPYTQTFVFVNVGRFYHWNGNFRLASEYIDAANQLCISYGYPFYRAGGLVLNGNLLARAGNHEQGLAESDEGIGMIESARTSLVYPLLATVYAQTLGLVGDPERGLGLLPDAVATMERTGARHFEIYLYLVKAALLRQAKLPTEAERAFEQTIKIAQRRGLKGAELKATIGLAKLDHLGDRKESCLKSLQNLCEALGDQTGSTDVERAQQLIAAHV